MNYKVRILRAVSEALAKTGLERAPKLRLFNALYGDLETKADHYRHNRVVGRPSCFYYHSLIVTGDSWRRYTFVVNDQDEPGVMIVVACGHQDS